MRLMQRTWMALPFTRSLFWKLLCAFLLLSVVPLGLAGLGVARQVDQVREMASRTSQTYETRAQDIAGRLSAFLRSCENDLREFSRLPRSDQAYAEFSQRHQRAVWTRSGANDANAETRVEAPVYRELAFIDPNGQEQVLVMRGQVMPAERRRNVADPAQTTYRGETYFADALNLKPGEIFVSHLTGFHINKIETLGVEKLIAGLQGRDARQKQIYRYLLYELLRTAGEIELISSFSEGERTVLVYGLSQDKVRVLVDAPPQLTPEELRVHELELRSYLTQLNPEDVVEGAIYDGVIRFAMPATGPDGAREGLVVLSLDHLHLQQFTQHVKAMEENATVFAGYRDADYTFLFDDQGWVITHPKLWNIRGVDRLGRLLSPYSDKTKLSEALVGRYPINLLNLDWKLGDGYHQVVLEARAGHTAIATSNNLAGKLCTRVFAPVFYDTGAYATHKVFGGIMMGTRADKFIELMRQINARIAQHTASLRLAFLWSLLGLVLVVGLLSVVLARSLVRPIRLLSAAAKRIGQGALETPVPALGDDEIGELGRSFAEMTGNLKYTILALEQKNLDLKDAQQKLLAAEREKRKELQRELQELQQEIARASFAQLVAESPQMKKIQEEIVRVAPSSATVLILGENGTGKEVIASAIHRNSPRKEKNFLKINCAAFNENLLESELFGHVKGSFTGATANRKGVFETADGGSLLLDEIGDMSPAMQTKLLRTLQDGEIVPLGSAQVIKVDVRLLAATNRDLAQRMREGAFREDLYHRLNVISIQVPPLRERKEDILPLAAAFLQRICEREKKPLPILEPQAEKFLLEYRWPGNVRELEHAIERAVIRSLGSTLRVEDFQLKIEEKDLPVVTEATRQGTTLAEVEKAYILSVLERHNGNKKATAEQLGIGYNTLWRKLKQYGKL